MLKIIRLTENIQIFQKISQEFRLKNIYETRTYFLEEISAMNWWVESTKKLAQLYIILKTYLF